MSEEARFLEEEAAQARAAMTRTALEIKQGLTELSDPRTWIKQYPWISAGAGLVGGILLGAKLTPNRSETVKEKWTELAEELKSTLKKSAMSSRNGEGEPSLDGERIKRPRPASFTLASLLPLGLKILGRALASPGPVSPGP
jgi:hypothetical protein